MGYKRVIPRDLFNEAKLLKNLAMMALYHLDNIEGAQKLYNIVLEDESKGFQIDMNQHSGDTSVKNLYVFDMNGTPIYVHHPINNRAVNSLWFNYKEHEGTVFQENGMFDPEFLAALKTQLVDD